MQYELEPLYSRSSTLATHRPRSPETISAYTSDETVEEGAKASSGPSIRDILLFAGIAIMLVWPWIFFGVVWAKGGLQMNNHLAKVVRNHPQVTTYFITFICSMITLIIGELFSLAIIRFAQEFVTYRKPTRPFDVTVLLAFRRQTWPWGKGMKDAKYLMTKDRWWPAVSVIICALIFPHLVSSTATLLTPTSFNRTAVLTGTELDFSSTDAECLSWFNNSLTNPNCGWQVYKNLTYTECLGGSQVVDFLEAGRGKIIESLTDDTEILTFVQLGAETGLHFQGSVQGLLPIGPNGVSAFDTLAPSPLSKPEIAAGMISYDYTLNHQGLKSNVSCSYTQPQTSPFLFEEYGNLYDTTYHVNCSDQGETDVLTNVTTVESVFSLNSTLVYWACQSASNLDGNSMASYTIYLMGMNLYEPKVGNITCTINSIQSAIYSVMYRSIEDTFAATEANASSPIRFSTLINDALVGLGKLISDSQNYESNLFAEMVLDFGLKSFGLPADPDLPPPQYLSLYEQMIQGIIEYEMTYLRLIYSTLPDAPSSCNRTVTGQLKYEVYGWFMTNANIGFLIPITIINLGALFALYRAMVIAKDGGYVYHPSHPRPVIYDEHIDDGERVPDEWMHKVSVRPTTSLKEYFSQSMRNNPEENVVDIHPMQYELEPLYSRPSTPATHRRRSPETISANTSDGTVEEGAKTSSGPSIRDILSFIGIAIMLVWPWIFFGVVWAKGGLQMNNHLAKVIKNHPQVTTYFITFICSMITLIIGELFSLAIIRFAQEFATYRKPTRPFHLTVLLAFRHQTWPWGKSVTDAKYLMTKDRWWPAVSVIICALIFPHLVSSTTTLLTPTSFNRTAVLTGTELDFSSTDAECLSWFNNSLTNPNCGWQVYKNLTYTECLGGSQMVDFLEAGRGKIIESLTDDTEILTFDQLGAKSGLHFQGSVQGLLPIGPNGVSAFDTLAPSPLSKPEIAAGMISYDYTLNHQGLKSNVSCSYTTTYPFSSFAVLDPIGFPTTTLTYNVNCTGQGKTDALINLPPPESAITHDALIYWACQDEIPTASYTIYLAGFGGYNNTVGNVTCVINPIQSAIYSVMYRSTEDIFSVTEANASSPIRFSTLINDALVGLRKLISNSQNFDDNLLAEMILDFGLKSFGLPADPDLPPPQYLSIYEQMIQGIIEYEMTYLRLIYSTLPDAPSSCNRTVTGQLRYEVYGWFMTNANIGFLIPITIVNLGALFALYRAMVIAKDGGYVYHPSQTRPVIYDDIDEGEQVPDEWMHKVSVRPTTSLKAYFSQSMRNSPEKNLKDI